MLAIHYSIYLTLTLSAVSRFFETMRNVHAIGLKIADLRTDAEKSSDEVDSEYYQTVFWMNMKAFSQFWHESNPPTATADDTTGSSQEVEVVEPCSADGLGKKRKSGVRQWDQPIYNHFPANADGNRTRYTSLTATTKDKDTGETKPTQGTIFEYGDCGWTRMILDGKTALCPRVCCVRMWALVEPLYLIWPMDGVTRLILTMPKNFLLL